MKDGADSGYSADRRKRYLEDQEKLEKMNKEIEQKKEEGVRFLKTYEEQNKAMMKRQQDINSRLTQIEIEKETAELRSKEELLKHNSKMQQLQQRYEDTWTQITNLQKERIAKEKLAEAEQANMGIESSARKEASKYKNSEFKELVMARAKLQQAQNNISVLENTKDPSDKEGKRTLASSNWKQYEKAKEQLEEAASSLASALQNAQGKVHELGIGIIEITKNLDMQEVQRGDKDSQRFWEKLSSGNYTKEEEKAIRQELEFIRKETNKSLMQMLQVAEDRMKYERDGLGKQAVMQEQLNLIRQIEERNNQALEGLKRDNLERARADLTGEGRSARRNAERDRDLENQKVKRRQEAQDRAAKRDADKGWALGENG